jgi:MarR family
VTAAGWTYFPQTFLSGTAIVLDPSGPLYGLIGSGTWLPGWTGRRTSGMPASATYLYRLDGLEPTQPVQSGAVSRGLGRAQRDILAALADSTDNCMTVPELARAISRSERQVRAAVRALEARGLVVITRGSGWRGAGDHGRLVAPWHRRDLPALTAREGEPGPGKPGYVAARDVEFVRQGMPSYVLLVWLPERREASQARYRGPCQGGPPGGSSAMIAHSQPGLPGSVTHSVIRPLRQVPPIRTQHAACRGGTCRSRQETPGLPGCASGMMPAYETTFEESPRRGRSAG